MKHLTICGAAAFVLAGCASTSERTGEMTIAEGAKMECRSVYQSGSILPKRVCNNKATWAAIEEQDAEAAKTAIDAVQSQRGFMPKREGGFAGRTRERPQ